MVWTVVWTCWPSESPFPSALPRPSLVPPSPAMQWTKGKSPGRGFCYRHLRFNEGNEAFQAHQQEGHTTSHPYVERET